ncbi:hypothetical protein K2173_027001 [Erythroxylum novogranatense]|uniref:TRF2/HOY1 PH-like domain-containing protein n=1 Tax=Erythroxylum novogranatense TaxID=1862640 RepID=A0AAV8U116_9ROSI|nr:hypothetical protein K2173_027001 [Erythroxylum novogranatense]
MYRDLTWVDADSGGGGGPVDGDSYDYVSAVANHKITGNLQTQNQDDEQTNLGNKILSLRPLGLKLDLTPSLYEFMEKNLHENEFHTDRKLLCHDDSGKLKASNFSALLLRIGSWERVSRNEGDIVAKCYYSKRKLVWEILDGRLKRKIEVQWSNIIAIQAKIEENESATLQIELNERPNFFMEVDPQPRKHTIWSSTSDFTGGEACHCRRHCLVFSPGTLEKHYQKLLQCDDRLRELSKKPFPNMSRSPNFPNERGLTDSTFNNNARMLNVINLNRGIQLACPTITAPLGLGGPSQSCHSLFLQSFNQMTSPTSDSQISNNVSDNSREWNQTINYYGDALASCQAGELVADVSSTQLSSALSYQSLVHTHPEFAWEIHSQLKDPVSCQMYSLSTCSQGVAKDEILNHHQNQLLIGPHCDGSYHLPQSDPWGGTFQLPEEDSKISINPVHYQDTNGYVHVNAVGGQFYQQQVAAAAPEVGLKNPVTHMAHNITYASCDQFYQQHASPMIVIQIPSAKSSP